MILYGNEHQIRASNLASALNETFAAAAPFLGGVPPTCSDTTLTIWGHGGPAIFAEMLPAQLNTLIRSWKAQNRALTTVELVTCDARHVQDDRDSYTDKLMPLLISGGKLLVNVKCMPRGGSSATVSELWADLRMGSNGYYFIAAKDDAALAQGVAVFQNAEAQVPAGTPVSGFYQALFPIAKAANDKAAMKGPLDYVASGNVFTKLRGLLATVTAYKDSAGNIQAVPKMLASSFEALSF
jgi:hypothetical protein